MHRLSVFVFALAAASLSDAIRAQDPAAFGPPLIAQAPAAADHDAHHPEGPKRDYPREGYSDGEVRRVDRDAQKVTLRHGPIPNLGMPDMTMVFRVTDPKMLEGLKTGDKVRFKADKVGGQYTVTALDPAK
jgi:Cu/Ag efflux protein CusF